MPLSEPDAASRNWTAFLNALNSGHDAWVKEAERNNNYYLGNQWSDADRAALESKGRPALTLNEILRVVNAVKGHQSTTRADVVYKARRKGATAEVADALTRLFSQILDANDYHDLLEPRLFDDGIIEDRGYLDVRMSYTHNVLGEIKIAAVDPRTVVLDPGAREYDPDTWTQVFRDRWLSLDDIELFYGKDKRQSVEALAASPGDTFGSRSVAYESFGGDYDSAPIDATDRKRVKRVRVIERQHRMLGLRTEFVDTTTGDTRAVPESWPPERVALVAQTYGFGVRRVMTRRIRWTVSADHVLLFDGWSPYDRFTIVPYFPIFRRGRPSGLVRHLIDPQDLLNKTESQSLHVINTTANSGWMLEEGSLSNMTPEQIEQRGAETGLILVYGRNREKPEKILPNSIPTGLENFSAKSRDYIQSIPGVAGLVGGPADPEISGVALDQTRTRDLTGLSVVLENLDYTRKLLARNVLSLVQKFYTEPRVYTAVDWSDPEQGEQEIAINQQVAGEIANNVTLGEYDVTSTTAPSHDTFTDMQFSYALQMREAGITIPDYHVILASPLAGKRQIAQEVKQLEGLGEPTQEQLMVQELQLRRLQAEVAEIEAKVLDYQASAQLDQARAQAAVQGEQREQFDVQSRYQMELERLKADLEKKRADLENKIQLAAMHVRAKEQLTKFGAAMGAGDKDRDRDADLGKAVLQSRTQLALGALNAAAKRQSENRKGGTTPAKRKPSGNNTRK